MSNTARQPPDIDHVDLVARMQAGEDAAFEVAVRSFGPRMLAVARRFLGQDQDAQDAVQDAFLNAFKSINNFQGDSRLETWLHRIIVNVCLMKLRSRKRKNERNIEDLLPKFSDDGHRADAAAEMAITFDTTVDDRETRKIVQTTIFELPDNCRTVLLLRDIEEKSTEETAELLGISPGAVKVRLHRARQALRELLVPKLSGERPVGKPRAISPSAREN